MNSAELIVMLTWNDVTVQNAKEIFMHAKDAPTNYWGFKDVGLTLIQMRELTKCMQEAGKTVFLESLATDEEATYIAMQMAVYCGVDVLLGGYSFEKTNKFAADKGLKHMPFIGTLRDHLLYGAMESLVQEAVDVCKTTAAGIDLAAYRYADGDPEELVKKLLSVMDKPLSIAGSVNSYERLDFTKNNNISMFTIGGAFFEKKFGETFAEQIKVVCDYLKG